MSSLKSFIFWSKVTWQFFSKIYFYKNKLAFYKVVSKFIYFLNPPKLLNFCSVWYGKISKLPKRWWFWWLLNFFHLSAWNSLSFVCIIGFAPTSLRNSSRVVRGINFLTWVSYWVCASLPFYTNFCLFYIMFFAFLQQLKTTIF